MSEPVTVIGANTVVNGNLEGDEDLTIEGRVEGTITLSRTLTIEQNGVVHANINVRNAIISGVLVGNVEAEDSVHVTEEGRVMGDIAAPRVILVDGASFRGNVDMGNFDVARGEVSAMPATRPAVRTIPEPVAEPEVEEPPVERPVTRVRSVAAPIRKPAPPKRAPAPRKPAPKPAPAKKAKSVAKKKSAPAPKVRSVGRAKATRKKR
ncbi:MAG: polymer-forming cytoskeletal protein [Proteobacteria bacterium]|nr:polymer-forming cytoskeletal protein [Pseudomonadota bacterium]